ncbi:hypothetical protein MEX01_34110 [Methylorubrum extorquens]|uniref:DUF3489 domain-containing protein n=1 Tax=Methylorubrum extorquens TaxID=408 RepID=UPI001168D440|nr:DUF3489 domain-containing protein [Methylorubrum extorquens]GEL42820.1 hypothetical protein MEX01_34110 [Methylorubrum extorquens]
MPRKSKSETLSAIQHLILAAAVSHPEYRLVRPEDIKPPTYRSALQALRRRGLIADIAAGNASGRRPAGPVLSRAGLTHVAPTGREVQSAAQPQLSVVRSPRPGSKLDCLVAMLARPDGASIDELITALNWLPHTTRAALTGLRKRGYALDTVRTTGVPTRYRITADEQHTTDAVTSSAVEPATEEAAR